MRQSEIDRRAKQIALDGTINFYPRTEEVEIHGFYTFSDIRKLYRLIKLIEEEGLEE